VSRAHQGITNAPPAAGPHPASLTPEVPTPVFTKASADACAAISAHPTGPQPGASGRKHRSLHSPGFARGTTRAAPP
jgi:hypothetical protein